MTGNALSVLREALEQARLVDSTQLQCWERGAIDACLDDGRAAEWLVARGWVTGYQMALVRAGRAAELDVGPYRILSVLGEGGMGQVFKARHRSLGRFVALKVIRSESVAKRESFNRFKAEARAVAQLAHPNIVLLFDACLDGQMNYLAMEFIDGTDLSRLVKEKGPLPIAEACEYVRQAALGLQHAHEKGLIHRDIKPSNLLLARPCPESPRPTVKVLDLGLARVRTEDGDGHVSITHTGTILGTPDFIAPEQARDSSRIDARADLYSLGCTLYYLLTGQPPFPGGTIIQKLLMHQLDAPTPVGDFRPDVPAAVRQVIDTLMHKDPACRYRTAAAAAEALAIALAGTESDSVLLGGTPARAVTDTTPLRQPEAGTDPTLVSRSTGSAVQLQPARREAVLKAHSGCVLALGFDPDGRLASAGIDETVRIWSGFPDGQREQELTGLLGEVHAVAFLPGRRTLITGAVTRDGVLWGWDWETGDRFCFRGDPQGVTSLHCVPVALGGKSEPAWQLAAGGPSDTVWVWDVVGWEARRRALLKGHSPGGTVVALRPEPTDAFASRSGFRPVTVAAADAAGIVRIWELGRWANRVRASWSAHPDGVRVLAYSPDGRLLATGGVGSAARVWNAEQPDEGPRELVGLSGQVRTLLFAGNSHLIGAADSGQVVVWEASTGRRLREWVSARTLTVCAAVSPDARRFAAGGSDGSVSVFALPE